MSRQQDHLLPLHDLANLQRPWEPATCQTLQLRREVWSWCYRHRAGTHVADGWWPRVGVPRATSPRRCVRSARPARPFLPGSDSRPAAMTFRSWRR